MKTFSALSCLAALILPATAVCAPPSYAPQPISARFNVRYSVPLGKKSAAAIGKDRMATTDRFDLPEAKPVVKGAAAESTIQGGVEGLPLDFYLRLTRSSDTDPGLLEINIIDRQTKGTLPGFPKKIPRPYAQAKEDGGQVTVDLKLTASQNAALERWLRAFLKKEGETVEGRITMDPPFLLVAVGEAP